MRVTKSRAAALLVALFAGLWLLPPLASAQIEEARVRVDGMV